jgi:hypothetical protein
VPEEPSNGELGRLIQALQQDLNRRMDTLNQRFGDFVQQGVYDANSRYITDTLARVQTELQQVRSERNQLEDAFEQYQREEVRRRETERQTRLYSAIIPVLVAVMSAAVAIWAVVR